VRQQEDTVTQSRRPIGRHFLQIPGPSPVPDRVLRAIDNPTIDHRGPAFGELGRRVLERLRTVFKTSGKVIVYPGSGTGAWEAALVNTLSPGDAVLMCRTGWFATLWEELARRLRLEPVFIDTDWRRGADVAAIGAHLTRDTQHRIKAVCVVHNETSTGCVSPIGDVRRVMDEARHPALLLVDTISSLASVDFRHDEWRVDVTIACSQKGLMLPPGLSFNAISDKALAARTSSTMPRGYWDWGPMLDNNRAGYFPYTPSTNLLYGLDVALQMIDEEGLDNVFARHERFAEATRRAVHTWGLEVQCAEARHHSPVLTGVRVPEGHSADALRASVLERHNMSLGTGLGQLKDKVFRIGHLGDINDLTLVGALGGVEMGLRETGIPHQRGGVQAAMDFLAGNA